MLPSRAPPCKLLRSSFGGLFLAARAALHGRGDVMSNKLRILMVEDSPADAELIEHELLKAQMAFSFQQVHNETDFLAALKEAPPDLVLADYALPAFDGQEALSLCRREYPDVPFIFISGTIGEEKAVELMKQGATDFVRKQQLDKTRSGHPARLARSGSKKRKTARRSVAPRQ